MALEDLLNFDVSEEESDDAQRLNRWSVSYTYRKLRSRGYRTGTTDFTFEDVLFSPGEIRTSLNYPVVPTIICQDVHALSAGYAISDKTSINVIVPLIRQATEHISSVPGFADFVLKSNGIGDIGVRVSHKKRVSDRSSLTFTIGARVPTGSIDKTGDTPRNGSGTLERLPYTMQLGSGTFDFTGAVNYSKRVESFNFGVNANSTVRTGKNDNDYRLGNNYGAAAWAQYSKHHVFQPGIKLNVRAIEKINGADVSLMVPGAFPFPAGITNPENYGGTKANISATLKVCPKADCSVSFSGEIAKPIYQHLNGIQPKSKSYASISAGLRF